MGNVRLLRVMVSLVGSLPEICIMMIQRINHQLQL